MSATISKLQQRSSPLTIFILVTYTFSHEPAAPLFFLAHKHGVSTEGHSLYLSVHCFKRNKNTDLHWDDSRRLLRWIVATHHQKCWGEKRWKEHPRAKLSFEPLRSRPFGFSPSRVCLTDSMQENRVSRWYFGGVSSSAAACVTHPLDLIKVNYRAYRIWINTRAQSFHSAETK